LQKEGEQKGIVDDSTKLYQNIIPLEKIDLLNPSNDNSAIISFNKYDFSPRMMIKYL
jgi:hypothetical protein